MKEILALLYELARWGRVYMEIKSRTLLYDRKKEVDKEIKELEDEIQKLRSTGNHAAADQLLLSQVRAASFERGLSSLADRTDIYSSKTSNVSGLTGSGAEGQADNRVTASVSS